MNVEGGGLVQPAVLNSQHRSTGGAAGITRRRDKHNSREQLTVIQYITDKQQTDSYLQQQEAAEHSSHLAAPGSRSSSSDSSSVV